ncbi:unnamed protein product [Symbiodinium natans]|uniref:Uncharacterized protein n=1 Tax=Symbiodinium natans TaxID=878477 RepID=A0A812UZG6_9DINO|nr:unnamed protein product [Symbiodinium natans]
MAETVPSTPVTSHLDEGGNQAPRTRPKRSGLSWLCSVFGLVLLKIVFAIANILLPVILVAQMMLLDNVMLQQHSWAALEWIWILLLVQMALLFHLCGTALNGGRGREARTGGLQWITYCWLIAATGGILFFDTLPMLRYMQGMGGDSLLVELVSPRSVMTVMWLTPLFYSVLAFGSLRQVFAARGDSTLMDGRRQRRRRQDYATLDAALLLDMVWHVVIDMIDIVNMMFLDSPESGEGSSTRFLSQSHPVEVQQIKLAAGTFIIMALFFHQQSYPSVAYQGGSNTSNKSQELAAPDVVKARKRSAIISILLVDLPFFTIRTYIYVLALSIPEKQVVFLEGQEVPRPQLDKWWVKNVLCMMLQAMQLRFVQQAESERSQSLRWWDLRRQGDAAAATASLRKIDYDAHLHNAMATYGPVGDHPNKLEYAFAELAAYSDTMTLSPSSEVISPRASVVSLDADEDHDHHESGDLAAKTPSAAHHSSRCRCCRRCCRGCWSKSGTSFNIFCHTMMGLVLGWLIAKVDFGQLFTDMVVGHGLAASQ